MKLKLFILIITFLFALSWRMPVVFAQNNPAPPALLNTDYPSVTGPNLCVGTVTGITCDLSYAATASGLQAALDEAGLSTHDNEGATVVLNSTTTFTGSLTLRNRSTTASGWIIIRTSDMAGLPAEGTRVNTSHAAAMPKMEYPSNYPNDGPVIKTEAGVSSPTVKYPRRYRLVGLEVRLASVVTRLDTGLIVLGNYAESNPNILASDITIDRCYIHGPTNSSNTANLKNGILFQGRANAVIDSYIAGCFSSLTGSPFDEAHGIGGWNGPGPFKIVNNYIEGSGENIIFGGTPPAVPNLVPADFEIQRNHLKKPLEWRTGPSPKKVKNLLELKNGKRALINGNVMENCWDYDPNQVPNAQKGEAILLSPSPQDSGASAAVTDVQITNNRIIRAASAVEINGRRDGYPNSAVASRVVIKNNLLEEIDAAAYSFDPAHRQVFGLYESNTLNGVPLAGPQYVSIIHNTVINSNNRVVYASGYPNGCPWTGGQPNVKTSFVFTDNIVAHNGNTAQSGGITGDCQGIGDVALDAYFPGVLFEKNVMMGGTSSLYIQHNTNGEDNAFPAMWGAVGFTDMAQGNYRLLSTSPYKNDGTDGKDIGVDQDALEMAISGGGGSSDVIWENKVGVVVFGNNDLMKDVNTAGWSAGATSQQTLTSGDGYVEFTTDENDTGKACGLSNGNNGQNINDIDFAISLGSGNAVRVYEGGTQKGTFGNYLPGERYRVAVEGGVVKYYKNWTPGATPFYTSVGTTPTYPLLVDTSFYTLGATVTDVAFVFSAPSINWENKVGVVVFGNNDLMKDVNTAGWSAGATSQQTLTSGDGYVEFTTDENDTGKACGLSNGNNGQNINDIDFAISLGSGNAVRVYEGGTQKGTFGNYLPGERYRVAVEAGVVKYYKNWTPGATPFYTSVGTTPTYPLLVDTSFYTLGATVTDVAISGGWSN